MKTHEPGRPVQPTAPDRETPAEKERPEPTSTRPEWVLPDDFVSRCTSVVLVLCVYSALCIWVPIDIGARANPAMVPQGVKPAWSFLFLYEYMRLVPPFVGALTPAALLLILGALPFLDRNPAREPRQRVFALLLAAGTVVAILTLTYRGWVS